VRARRGRQRERIRQPWYPVQERYGLIFAYLGLAHRKPVLPRYDALERLDEGERLEADGSSIGGGGPVVVPGNWLQHYENLMDTLHVPILHGSFSGPQFTAQMGLMPEIAWAITDRGVKATSDRRLPDGTVHHRISEAVLPTLRVIPNPRVAQYARVESIGWVLPHDDTSFRIYTAGRVRQPGELTRVRSRLNGKLWEELTEAEHRAFPGDYEAQVGQGPLTLHSEEHLVSSDRGVALVRRVLRQQLDALTAGRDPIRVCFDADAPPITFEAGNFLHAS
jgi:phenylpropionate dioxygenase-like ring-hydroxylating dioxygenase large terminal subunit